MSIASQRLLAYQRRLGRQVILAIGRVDDPPLNGINVNVGDLGRASIGRKSALELDCSDLALKAAVDGDIQCVDFVPTLCHNGVVAIDVFPILVQIQAETGCNIFPVTIEREVGFVLGRIDRDDVEFLLRRQVAVGNGLVGWTLYSGDRLPIYLDQHQCGITRSGGCCTGGAIRAISGLFCKAGMLYQPVNDIAGRGDVACSGQAASDETTIASLTRNGIGERRTGRLHIVCFQRIESDALDCVTD